MAEGISFLWELTEETFSYQESTMLNQDYKDMLSQLLDNNVDITTKIDGLTLLDNK